MSALKDKESAIFRRKTCFRRRKTTLEVFSRSMSEEEVNDRHQA